MVKRIRMFYYNITFKIHQQKVVLEPKKLGKCKHNQHPTNLGQLCEAMQVFGVWLINVIQKS